MESMWANNANIVIAWSRSRKTLKLMSDLGRFGPFWAVTKSRRPIFGIVGYKPQLVAAFFIATSTLDPI